MKKQNSLRRKTMAGKKRVIAALLLIVGLCLVPTMGRGEILLQTLKPTGTVGSWLGHLARKQASEDEALWNEIESEIKKIYDILSFFALCIDLQDARIEYMMRNPTTFQEIDTYYDLTGDWDSKGFFPESVDIDTKGRILIGISDARGRYSDISRVALLETFKANLEVFYSYIKHIATDMDADIVAKFYSRGDIPLGYFYQGEYHLWEEKESQ